MRREDNLRKQWMWRLYEARFHLAISWVATLSRLGGMVIGSVPGCVGATVLVYKRLPCAACSGRLSRAVLQLKYELWFVGSVAPEGVVGLS